MNVIETLLLSAARDTAGGYWNRAIVGAITALTLVLSKEVHPEFIEKLMELYPRAKV